MYMLKSLGYSDEKVRVVNIHEHERGRNTEWVRVDTKASKSRLKASESRIDMLYQPIACGGVRWGG
jgi:hypothetical protein